MAGTGAETVASLAKRVLREFNGEDPRGCYEALRELRAQFREAQDFDGLNFAGVLQLLDAVGLHAAVRQNDKSAWSSFGVVVGGVIVAGGEGIAAVLATKPEMFTLSLAVAIASLAIGFFCAITVMIIDKSGRGWARIGSLANDVASEITHHRQDAAQGRFRIPTPQEPPALAGAAGPLADLLPEAYDHGAPPVVRRR